MTKRRSLEELTLLDRFLFAETMEDPENLRILLEIILGKDLVLKHLPQTEKELRTSPLNRMARVDVWGMDEEGTVYSAESQKRNTGNLPRRSRFYQGMSDSELLEAGEADFNRLSDLYIILIAPFDLFGKGLCRYTFRMRCDESRDLELGDGAVRIFLNTRGTDREGISGELAELLEYIEHTNEKRRVKRMKNKTQEERRIWLIRQLQKEMPQYQELAVPKGEEEQWRLLRSLFNVRPPYPASEEFLKVQDAYLTEMVRERGIVDGESLPPVRKDARISLWQGDITRLRCDAIVNAANSALLGCWQPCHSCIDNIIHSLSGVQLRIKCNEIMQAQGHEEETGKAKITPAYNLPCRYVLHTVGPIISGPLRKKDCELLEDCYRSCLELAAQNGLKSVAFCCISTGVFHFPQEKAAEIAVETVEHFLKKENSVQNVIFNVFTDRDLEIYRGLLEG